jgi:hypothetical protein
MNPIKEMIDNPHWVNTKYKGYWDFLLQSYEGGIDYTSAMITQQPNVGLWDSLFSVYVNGKKLDTTSVSGNLFMHPRERTQDYQRRLNMSYYYNFCAPILDIYSNHLFKNPVIEEFEEIEGTLEEVGDDIDRTGQSISEFRKELSNMAQLYGHIFVVIDSPNIPTEEVVTLQDQINKRAFPYLTMHIPQNIINWSLDEYGNPHWVLIREVYDGNKDAAAFDPKKRFIVQYRLWTRDYWFLYDSGYTLINEGIHGLGVVPIVCAFDKKSKKVRNFLGVSTLADIAFIARDIYNSCSELKQILRDQTFSFLAINGDASEYSELEIGVGKGLLYPEGRDVPQYISPPSSNAEVYFEHIDRQVAKIFQLAKLDSGGVSGRVANPQVIADQQSGISKAWDFNQTNSALSDKAGNLEDAEMKIWNIFAAIMGQDFTGTITYPNEFSIASLMDDLTELEKEARLDFGKTFNIEVRKAIIKKKFPRKPDDEIDAMASEIEGDLQSKKDTEGGNGFNTNLTNRFSNIFNKTLKGGQTQKGE